MLLVSIIDRLDSIDGMSGHFITDALYSSLQVIFRAIFFFFFWPLVLSLLPFSDVTLGIWGKSPFYFVGGAKMRERICTCLLLVYIISLFLL